jgi:hypothetical protein
MDRLDSLIPREELINNILPPGLIKKLTPHPPKFISEFALSQDDGNDNEGENSIVDQTTPNNDAFVRLSTFLRSKPDGPTLITWMENDANMVVTQKSRLLLHTALALGSASFTHLRAAMERIRPALEQMKNSIIGKDQIQEFERDCLRDVCTFWKQSSMWATFAVQILSRIGIVSDDVTLKWLLEEFQNEDEGMFSSQCGWRILREIDDLLEKGVTNSNTSSLNNDSSSLLETLASNLSNVHDDVRLKNWIERRIDYITKS